MVSHFHPKRKQVKQQLVHLRDDLEEMHKDWKRLMGKGYLAEENAFLSKMANDIKQLSKDALQASSIESCREKAELISYLLTTPWGAPFVGETTLLDAAKKYRGKNIHESALYHLMRDFANYGHKFETQIFSLLEDISEELETP